MRRTGTVVRDTDGTLKLKVIRPAECEHCGMCDGRELLLDLPAGEWHTGDAVDVDMPADRLLRASALAYLLPLAMLLLGLIVGNAVGEGLNMSAEAASAIMGIGFMALGFGGVKLIAPKLRKKGALNMDMTPCGRSMSDVGKLETDRSK